MAPLGAELIRFAPELSGLGIKQIYHLCKTSTLHNDVPQQDKPTRSDRGDCGGEDYPGFYHSDLINELLEQCPIH